MAKRLVILDGYSLLYRAFFATRYMSTSDGRPTNALYGFVGMLFYILEHDEPDAVVVALDAPGKTFRHTEYAEYKGTRRDTAPELIVQLKESRELIAALGITSVELTGYEADDVVGTISRLAEANGYNTTIVTGDLDSLQLVDDCVQVMTSKIGVTDVKFYKPEDVVERYEFEAKYVPDYKAIVGDTSDNIPGVPGIGAKGATELIKKWGTIENILEHFDEIEPKHQKKIEPEEVRTQMMKSKWLATIDCEAPVQYDFKPFQLTEEQFEAARAFFELYELRSHARRMPLVLGKYLKGFTTGSPKPTEIKNEVLEITLAESSSFEELRDWVGDRLFALFFDSAPITPEDVKAEAESKKNEGPPDLFSEPAPVTYQPLRVSYVAVGKDVRRATEADGLALFSLLPSQAVMHDAKPTYKLLLKRETESVAAVDASQREPVTRHSSPVTRSQAPLLAGEVGEPEFSEGEPGEGVARTAAQTQASQSQPVTRIACDTLLAGYVLQSGRANYALRDLVQGYLEITPPTNGAEMSAALSLLEPALRDRLQKEGQEKVLDEIELPLVPILAEMETTGIKVNPDVLKDFSIQLEQEIIRTAQCIHEAAGSQFNIGSPKQLGEILFERLQIPGQKKTKTGYATGAEVLQLLAPTHQICADVLSWRELSKLKSTYADALPKLIDPKTGRIHTTYNQTVAATGRLSSNEPNLQNIPIRTDLGRTIRRAFVAAPGYKLASFDYSQIELRILADMCGDENLVRAFEEGVDVHTATAALMWNMPATDVQKEQRAYSKMLNFAVLYGVSEYGLANQLGGGFSISEAKALIEQYRERFPKVKAFTDSVVAEARSKGFTTTLYGRRRYFPDIHNANRNERMYAERQAMNAPIQGTASDMIKLAMIRVDERLKAEGARSRMLLQVHDELVFELVDGEERLIEMLRSDMESALKLKVPIVVDAKLGENWEEMRENNSRAHSLL
jgi:DNA polymerase-1